MECSSMEKRADKPFGIHKVDIGSNEDSSRKISETTKSSVSGGEQLSQPEFIISHAQIIHTLYRTANISVGLSWSHNVPRNYAGILCAHTLSVEICRLSIAFNDSIQEIISDAVE